MCCLFYEYLLYFRLIVHNDQFNPMLNMIEEFSEELKKFNPKLFVLGGLQMLDNFPFPPGQPTLLL